MKQKKMRADQAAVEEAGSEASEWENREREEHLAEEEAGRGGVGGHFCFSWSGGVP